MSNDALRDPATAHCRIYVGNLKETTTSAQLQNIFQKYGSVLGTLVSRNFGFVQYDNEQSVSEAIENENQKMYNGRKIMVSKVQPKKNAKQNDKGPMSTTAPSQNTKAPEPVKQNVANNPSPNQSKPDVKTNVPAAAQNSQSAPVPASASQQQQAQNNTAPNRNQPIQQISNRNNSNNSNNANSSANNNNNSNNNTVNTQQGNRSRPQWLQNRNNNRNNSNQNNNEMNLHSDRERSPLDDGK